MIKERASDRKEAYISSSVNRPKQNKSPQKVDWAQNNNLTPFVSPFSPFPKESSETIKK